MTDFTKGRERPTNYIEICNNIADSYPFGTYHGVQKDAIQNAVDARKGHKPIKVDFRLIENKMGKFFTITDTGTMGLTGPLLEKTEQYEEELPEYFHWARFESFAFTKRSEDAIGARGQGKFIFLHASQDHTMYYDTLRDDGIYRLGATQATRTGCPILPPATSEPWEGQRAVKELKDKCGLRPLQEIGTRVIIVDPNDELLTALLFGQFARAIRETWFRFIEKEQLIISVPSGDGKLEVELPPLYPLPENDTLKHKVWLLHNDFDDNLIRLSGGEEYRVKRFHVLYLNEGTVEEDMQGVAIIHHGMKITSLPMSLAPPEVRKRVTGYIEFDRELDRELRKGINQNPNHYDLKWRRQLPQAIKEYINRQLVQFGRKKLGLGADPREVARRRRNDAEEWAMRQLQKFARDLDLFGTKGGRRHPRPPEPPPPKIVGVSINNFGYPDPDIAPRVNWGQAIKGLGVTSYNRSRESLSAAVSLAVLHGDSVALRFLDREKAVLECGQHKSFGKFDIIIDDEGFPEPGEYRLKATLVDTATGEQIDSVSRKFWIEQDPPLRQPFLVVAAPGFSEPDHRRQWLTHGSINNSPTLYYNTDHPAYRAVEADEDQLADYMLQIMLEGALRFVLMRPDLKDGTPDYHPLETAKILGETRPVDRESVPETTYGEVARYFAEFRWRMYESE